MENIVLEMADRGLLENRDSDKRFCLEILRNYDSVHQKAEKLQKFKFRKDAILLEKVENMLAKVAESDEELQNQVSEILVKEAENARKYQQESQKARHEVRKVL